MNYYLLLYGGALKGDSGEMVKAKYNMSKACPKCGTGAYLDALLPVKSPDNKLFYETFQGDFIISEKIHNELLLNKVKIDLKPIVHYKSFSVLKYYHLTSSFTLPKMDSSSTGFELSRQCEFCQINGYFDQLIIGGNDDGSTKIIDKKYVYKDVDEKLLNFSDVFTTWEHFGISWLNSNGAMKYYYARPRLIISENMKNIFENMKIKFADFCKVEIYCK